MRRTRVYFGVIYIFYFFFFVPRAACALTKSPVVNNNRNVTPTRTETNDRDRSTRRPNVGHYALYIITIIVVSAAYIIADVSRRACDRAPTVGPDYRPADARPRARGTRPTGRPPRTHPIRHDAKLSHGWSGPVVRYPFVCRRLVCVCIFFFFICSASAV